MRFHAGHSKENWLLGIGGPNFVVMTVTKLRFFQKSF
jgi:hypothetical protein